MLNKILVILFLIISKAGWAQSVTEMPLYPGSIPGAKQSALKEQVTFIKGVARIYSVITPTLTRYSPAKPNGTSIVICPGGGYAYVTMDYEGVEVAKALNEFGITAFVLKYRLPNDTIMINKSIGPLQDAQQAIRVVREQAAA